MKSKEYIEGLIEGTEINLSIFSWWEFKKRWKWEAIRWVCKHILEDDTNE